LPPPAQPADAVFLDLNEDDGDINLTDFGDDKGMDEQQVLLASFDSVPLDGQGAGAPLVVGCSHHKGSQLPRGEDHAPSRGLRHLPRWLPDARGSHLVDEL
jgi:hypothetical protein